MTCGIASCARPADPESEVVFAWPEMESEVRLKLCAEHHRLVAMVDVARPRWSPV